MILPDIFVDLRGDVLEKAVPIDLRGHICGGTVQHGRFDGGAVTALGGIGSAPMALLPELEEQATLLGHPLIQLLDEVFDGACPLLVVEAQGFRHRLFQLGRDRYPQGRETGERVVYGSCCGLG